MRFLDWLLASEAWYRQWRGGTWTFCDAKAGPKRRFKSFGFDFNPTVDRIRVVNNPLHPSFERDPSEAALAEAARLLGVGPGPVLLHVGSNIQRKRIDDAHRGGARVARVGAA